MSVSPLNSMAAASDDMAANMNSTAAAYFSHLRSCVTSVHDNTSQLLASATSKPPAYSDASGFLLDMEDRVAEAAAQLESLDEWLQNDVSFEDLLAKCMKLYTQNEESFNELETQLQQFGYVKEASDKIQEGKGSIEMNFVEDLKERVRSKDNSRESSVRGSVDSKEDMVASQFGDLYSSSSSLGRSQSQADSACPSQSTGSTQPLTGVQTVHTPLPPAPSPIKLDVDDMSTVAFSLEDFGLSASTLASLARLESASPEKYTSPVGKRQQQQAPSEFEPGKRGESFNRGSSLLAAVTPSPVSRSAASPGILSKSTMPFLGLVSDEEYSQVFPWLQRRVPLKELNEAIVKINECLVVKQASTLQGDLKQTKPLEVEDTVLLNLGPNMKACLLFLVQIDRLVTVSSNGRTTYRPSELEKLR
ncbi:hypothetical protein R1flu_002131 [Riccia fluitans]|uniref:Spindle and kinetochore-associated protein 3 n=1 Tax=Riccia fluitans TaxID=41844 RepID=A0ABD1Y5A1_9MARC